jgi:hypothetical protein
VGWELVRLLQESLVTLEATASRVLAAEVAGTIALWTQLYTFEDGPPEVMAWVALIIFIGSISFLGIFLRPRRVVRFWDRAIPDELFLVKRPVGLEEESDVIAHISSSMRQQRDLLESGIRVSVPLALIGLLLVLVAYGVDKRWYPP